MTLGWQALVMFVFVIGFGFALAVIFRKFFPKTAMGWTKLVARLGMVYAAFLAAMRILAAVIPDGVLPIQLRTVPFWPELPAQLHQYKNTNLRVDSGGFDTASVYVHGANLAERIWMVAGGLALSATIVLLCYASERIAQAVVAGTEFRAVSGKLLRRIALGTVIGGEVASWATTIGTNMISMRLQDVSYGYALKKTIENPWFSDSNGGVSYQIFGHPQITAGYYVTVEIWPILVGIGLYLLARIFESGSKLAQDTDGLV
jgi:hypothetical protein